MENLQCNELIQDFENERVKEIMGVSERDGQLIYIVKVIDSIEPIVTTNWQARVFAPKVFRYWLGKLEFVEPGDVIPNGLQVVDSIDENAIPEIICKLVFDVTIFNYCI